MKKTFFATIIGLSLITGSETVRAQSDEKTPVPQAPYLAPVPDYGHWKVTFRNAVDTPAASTSAPTPAGPGAAAPPAPGMPSAIPAPSAPIGSIETIKTGDLRGITLALDNGTTRQFTCQGNWVLSSTAKGPTLGLATPGSLPYGYYTTGFILLDGVTINMSTFKEAAKHNGVMAFHYKSGAVDVWIDPNSMLPLGARKNEIEVSYEFLTPPPRPFPIPKDQAELLEKEQAAYKSTSSMR